MSNFDQLQGQLSAQQNCLTQGYIGFGGPCTLAHPPADAEKHARQRLAQLGTEIPRLTQELAEMATEKKRLEKMLSALETP